MLTFLVLVFMRADETYMTMVGAVNSDMMPLNLQLKIIKHPVGVLSFLLLVQLFCWLIYEPYRITLHIDCDTMFASALCIPTATGRSRVLCTRIMILTPQADGAKYVGFINTVRQLLITMQKIHCWVGDSVLEIVSCQKY